MTRALQKREDGDFEIFGALEGIVAEGVINIDAAVDLLFRENGWPLLGGPSGRGWSFFSVAGRCGQLFKKSYDVEARQLVRKVHAAPLQIGALFHTLQALYYGAGLGSAYVLPDRGGLVSEDVKLAGRRKRWQVPPTAADALVASLKALAASDKPGPDLSIVEEAERLFDAHTNWWGSREDVTPLGVEVFADHKQLGYTCRYDLIAKVGPNDPLLADIAGGTVIFEKKTAKWIDEKFLEGWQLDGEVLGQIMCWKPSGMEDIFGPLAAIVIDVVSKAKMPECRRVVLPVNPDGITVQRARQHERWIRWLQAEIYQWRALEIYPQKFMNCYTRYGRCEEFDNCVLGLTEGQ